MLKHIFLLLVLIFCYFLWEQRPVKYGPGVIVNSQPKVEAVNRTATFDIKNATLIPKYQIEGTIRVIAKKSYWFDNKRHISPTDLVLGWNRMSDDKLLRKLLITIDDRSYDVQMAKPPSMRGTIHEYVLMAHAIPATERIREKLATVRRGQFISFSGFIVDVRTKDEKSWVSPVRDGKPAVRSAQWIWIENLFFEEPSTLQSSEATR